MATCPNCSNEMIDSKKDTTDATTHSRLISQYFGGKLGVEFKDEAARKDFFDKIHVSIFYCKRCHTLLFIPRMWKKT